MQHEAVVRGRRIVDFVVDGRQAAARLRLEVAAEDVLARDVGRGCRGQGRGAQGVERQRDRRVELLAKPHRVAAVVPGHQRRPVAAGVRGRMRVGGVKDDMALRNAVLAGHPAPDGAAVLAAESGQVGGHQDQCLSRGVPQRQRARPDRIVDPLGEPVALPKRYVRTESRQMDPSEALTVRVELGNRSVRRRVFTERRGDVDGRRPGQELGRGRRRQGRACDGPREEAGGHQAVAKDRSLPARPGTTGQPGAAEDSTREQARPPEEAHPGSGYSALAQEGTHVVEYVSHVRWQLP